MKKHNFSAGPAVLPRTVIEQAAQAVLNWNNKGLSILEVSHRGKDFEAVMAESEALLKELYGLDDSFSVLFLTGGASTQFFMVPMNLLGANETAAYIDSGVWANKAIKEAKPYGNIAVVASSKPANYTYIPKDYDIPHNAKYLHITTNNTIYGTQYQRLPDTDVRLVADMSSDFLSRPIDAKRFDLIYAGAQKNLGPAGVTVVILKKDILGKTNRPMPTMLDYRVHIENGSMYNTPPVFPIYVSMLTMRWIKQMGGLEAISQHNHAKAALLYNEIDRNSLFKTPVATEDRSLMNIVFVLKNNELEAEFSDICKQNGIEGIKGHRSVGGFRASTYNALEKESVQVLVDLMKDFEQKKG